MRERIKRTIIKSKNDDLIKSSFFLISNTGTVSILGFLFWTLAAWLFTVQELGLATTTISALSVISSFASLGLSVALLRYMPNEKNKDKLFWSAIWISVLLSIILTGVFIFVLKWIFPELTFIQESLIFIIIVLISGSSAAPFKLIESLFLTKRKSSYVLSKNSLWGILRLLGLVILKSFGMIALVIAWFFSQIISKVVYLKLMKEKVVYGIDKKSIKKMLPLGMANYISMISTKFQEIGFPLYVAILWGVESTAYFYISWMIANSLFAVSRSVGMSFLTESSHNKNTSFKKALGITYGITILGIVLGLIFGKSVLSIFGEAYVSNGLALFKILLFSSVFFGFNQLMLMYYNFKEEKGSVRWINFSIVLLTIICSTFFLSKGVIAIGIGWLIANFIVFLILGIKSKKILFNQKA